MPRLIARWNPARDVWETETTGLFCEHSDVFSETWPSSGMTRGGVAYVLPMSVPLTDGSASSSLLGTPRCADGMQHDLRENVENPRGRLEDQVSMLPTPMSNDWRGPNMQRRDDGERQTTLADAVSLLPTPTGRDHKGANQRGDETCLHGALLPTPTATPYGSNQSPSPGAAVRPSLEGVMQLLPTPTAMDSHASGGNSPSNVTLTDAVVRTSLGASTNPRFAAGNECSDDPRPHLPNPDLEVDSA